MSAYAMRTKRREVHVPRRAAGLGLVGVLAVAAPAGASDDDLALREITLHRAGIGSFERAAEIDGDRTFRMTFPREAIRDVLKSMTLLDLGGGRIGPVRFGAKEPLQRRLAELGVDLSGASGTLDLFRQLRGVRVRVQTPGDVVEGTVLGVEDRYVGETAVRQPHVLLVTSGGVRSVPVAELLTYDLLDPGLADELRRALQALAEERSDRTKAVELSFLGPAEPPRTVVVSYVQEVPVWKSSYRLVLPDGADEPATMQGWAIVENTTGEDWRDVRVSLAAGDPISFVMDLDQPIFSDRPRVPLPLPEGLAPVVYESGAADPAVRRRTSMVRPGRELQERAAAGDPAAAARLEEVGSLLAEGAPAFAVESESLGETQAAGEEVGDEFHFTLTRPVTLARESSAMLPILLAPVTARRVTIYGPGIARELFPQPNRVALLQAEPARREGDVSVTVDSYDAPGFALKGVELVNETGQPLLPGPVSVFDGGTYAGDAFLDETTRGETRLIAYARDPSLEVRSIGDASRRLVRIRIAGGRLEESRRETQGREYRLRNHDEARSRTVLLAHPRKEGWTLAEPSPPASVTDAHYRFEVVVPPGEEVRLRVALESNDRRRIEIDAGVVESAIEWRSHGLASTAVLGALWEAQERRLAVERVREELRRVTAERTEIVADQARIRENLPHLERTSELFGRLVAKLTEQESRLEELESELRDLESERAAASAAYDDFLRGLDID